MDCDPGTDSDPSDPGMDPGTDSEPDTDSDLSSTPCESQKSAALFLLNLKECPSDNRN